MKHERIIIACFLTTVYLISCQAKETTFISTPSPTHVQASTPSTGETQETLTSEQNLISNIDDKCPIIKEDVNENLAEGSLLFWDFDTGDIFHFDFSSATIELFVSAGEDVQSYAVSPNGKWLAYETREIVTNTGELVITSLNKEQTFLIPWEADWINIAYWLDNDRILIKLSGGPGTDEPTLLTFNPFSGQRETLTLHASDVNFSYNFLDWNRSGWAIYNVDLDRAVYAQLNQEFVLWDTENSKAITSIQSIVLGQFPTKAPQWSLDGERVVVIAPNASFEYVNDELFSIEKNGEIRKLTNFSGKFSIYSINRNSWAPDNTYIAMFISTDAMDEQLAILDLATNESSLYCIQGDTQQDYRRFPAGFYPLFTYSGVAWSPNSPQLVLENRVSESRSNLIFLDIKKNIAFEIIKDENVQPIGWMISDEIE